MSNDFLINTDKTTNNNSTKTDISTKNDKKEGMSLFDSLMNDAKNDSKSLNSQETNTTNSSKNDNKATINNQKEEKTDSIIKPKEEKTDSSIKPKEEKTDSIVKPKEEKETISNDKVMENKTSTVKSDNKIETQINLKNSEIKSVNLDNVDNKEHETVDSLKRMVEKLVDIIVSTAKETKKDFKDISKSELIKDKINKLLEDKAISAGKVDTLKSNVDKIISTTDLENIDSLNVKNAIGKALKDGLDSSEIKKSIIDKVDVVKESANSIKKENIVIKDKVTLNPSLTKEELDENKKTIKQEVSKIKEQVKEIKSEISIVSDEDVDKNELKNNLVKENIKVNVQVIEESVDEIEIELDDITPKNKSVIKTDIEKSHQKIEFKVETIKDSISIIEEESTKIVIVKTTENEVVKNEKIVSTNTKNNLETENTTKEPLLASMFLNSQRNIKEKRSLEEVKDAKSNILEKKTVDSVKDSANKLELNFEESDVSHEGDKNKKLISNEKNKEEIANNFINNKNLNKALLNQKLESNQNILQTETIKANQKLISDNIESETKITEDVEIAVHKEIVSNLQNKIIGAQQKMGSLMSDVARNMYLNYKPPVTAFRVNLNPANLGSISIIMKANKVDNSLSVSMNLSNSNTMEAFTENKTALQNAIQRQFNETSNVSINFGMQDQNSENTFSQFQQDQKENGKSTNHQDGTSEEDKDEQEVIENNDYM